MTARGARRCAAWSSLAALAALALAACIPPREPSRHLGGEAELLAAYVEARLSACPGGAFELAVDPRPREIIATMPAIYESRWRLRACGQELAFTLDCSLRGDTWACGAHEWPLPVSALEAPSPLAREIEAAARRAPACPAERTCAPGRCAEDGLALRRLAPAAPAAASGGDVARYEVERCGVAASVNVRCTREAPLQCVTTSSAPVDVSRSW